jgi:hypothetical protein
MKKTTEKPFNLQDLDDITDALQTRLKRDDKLYVAHMKQFVTWLNGLTRGDIRRIGCGELEEQSGHLIYYTVRHPGPSGKKEWTIPFDVHYLPELYGHLKNPTVIILRRIRRFLMSPHRKILARLEEEQAKERRLGLSSLDFHKLLEQGLNEVKRCKELGEFAKTTTRKLDILTKGLHVPAQIQSDFKMVMRMLEDPHHLRNKAAENWLAASSFDGSKLALKRFTDDCERIFKGKIDDIFNTMEKLSGIPFDRDIKNLSGGFNWYSLGTPLRRGEDFVRMFENEERTEGRIRRLTFFIVRTAWDADSFRERMEQAKPNPRNLQECCSELARIFFELEEKIRSSTQKDGDVQMAIRTDLENRMLSPKEAREAEQWVQQNKARLSDLKLKLFDLLLNTKATYADAAFPEHLEALLTGNEQGDASYEEAKMPKIGILDLHREAESLENQMVPSVDFLERLLDTRDKIIERKASMEGFAFQDQVRRACNGFEQYEEKLVELQRVETRLDEMRIRIEEQIIECYREMDYTGIKEATLERAFDLVVDHMLVAIKRLDYSAVEESRFRGYVEQALAMDTQTSLFHLDWLLHEIHVIPRQDQLINALADWEKTLEKEAFEEKQEQIIQNEVKLQALVEEIRAELRERLGMAEIKPQRLRFEVFGLADAYSGNLRALLEGFMRMAPLVTSEDEGARLIANVQALESQTIEAQRLTKPDGEAHQKLAEMKRLDLLHKDIVRDLYEDLERNFGALDQLLKDINQGLKRLRLLQNRFGGDHDTEHLVITINIDDLEELKRIYHFVDSITVMDMKRFGVVYRQRYTLLDDLFEKAHQKNPDLPEQVAQVITGRVYKNYKAKRILPVEVKTTILAEVPEVLEFECQLLIRTLNFVSSAEIRNKVVYKAILRMLEQVKSMGRDKKRSLRRIWTRYRNAIDQYKPQHYARNYENNARALVTDANEIIGHLLEDL